MASNNLSVPSFPGTASPQRISTDSTARSKVALKPGRSLMDWIRLGRSGQDLTGVGGRFREVTKEELAKHNTQEDGWICLRGKVYNVSPYMEFHPGGIDELKRGIGQDATQLFDEIHKWVNAESMLEKCFVGRMSTSPSATTRNKGTKETMPKANLNLKPPEAPVPPIPNFDWYQTNKVIILVIYTKWGEMQSDFVIISRQEKELNICINIKDLAFKVHVELEEEITDDYTVKTSENGKVSITLQKILEKQWLKLGTPLDNHCTFGSKSKQAIQFHECTIKSISCVNHDTKLISLLLPETTWMSVPVGHHIHIHHTISGMEIVRSYTCVIPSLLDTGNEANENQTKGHVLYLMIKIYPDGALTPWLNTLNIGDTVTISNYDGSFSPQYLKSDYHLVLYAAGTGFTPMIRLIHKSLKADSRILSVKLLFFNKKERDILWKDQLDQLVANSGNRFEVIYILSDPDESWNGLTGRIRKELVSNYISLADDGKLLVCACGPIPFTKQVIQLCQDHGCQESQLFAFLG